MLNPSMLAESQSTSVFSVSIPSACCSIHTLGCNIQAQSKETKKILNIIAQFLKFLFQLFCHDTNKFLCPLSEDVLMN
jgi:hypothetical protein